MGGTWRLYAGQRGHRPDDAAREDMSVRKFGEKTQNDYIRHVKTFSTFLGRSPVRATPEDLRRFQVHQSKEGAQPPTINSSVAALRFFAFMIDFSHNRFVRVTNPAGPARQHAILFLVAVDHGRSCHESLRCASMSIVASRIARWLGPVGARGSKGRVPRTTATSLPGRGPTVPSAGRGRPELRWCRQYLTRQRPRELPDRYR